jgi:hypothetical protein
LRAKLGQQLEQHSAAWTTEEEDVLKAHLEANKWGRIDLLQLLIAGMAQ